MIRGHLALSKMSSETLEKSESEGHSVVFNSLWPHGILQTRILEWIVFPFSRGSYQPRVWTQVSHIAGRFFTSWATREAQEYWLPLNTCKKKNQKKKNQLTISLQVSTFSLVLIISMSFLFPILCVFSTIEFY